LPDCGAAAALAAVTPLHLDQNMPTSLRSSCLSCSPWRVAGLAEHRISNVLTLAGLPAALAAVNLGGASGFLNALAGAGVGLLCFLPLYLSKGMGAGDVKLMAAAGAFFGPSDAFVAALLSLASGAVLALVILLWAPRDSRGRGRHAGGRRADLF
jgi:prepilin peptidase CpaA